MFAPLTLIASFGAFAVYANAIGAYLLIGGALTRVLQNDEARRLERELSIKNNRAECSPRMLALVVDSYLE